MDVNLNYNIPVYQPRILHIITKGEIGGAQKHVLELISHLTAKYVNHVAMGSKGFLWEQLEQIGVNLYYIPSLIRAIKPTQDTKCLVQLIGLIKAVKPDLVSVHSSKAGILGRLAARLCRVPVVFTAHGWSFSEGVPGFCGDFYALTERIMSHWCGKIICVSEYDRLLALRRKVGQNSKVETIHNGISVVNGDLMAQPHKDNPVQLIMVARFAPPKDYATLIKSLVHIKTDKQYTINLVGDGPSLGPCRELAQRLNLGTINFLGSRDDVPQLMSKAQCFVLVSNWEGFPISILEAMRAGLPVIATDVGGIRESVVDGVTGYLIPRGQKERLAERLQQIIDNNVLRVKLGQNARERFINNFTVQHMLAKTISIYEELIGVTNK